jgi:hypothetical protein
MSDYNHDVTGKRIYQNGDLVSGKHSYGSKNAEIREGWSMSDNSIYKQQTSTLHTESR